MTNPPCLVARLTLMTPNMSQLQHQNLLIVVQVWREAIEEKMLL
ncbi:hypothetical protein DsansV1_C13g0117001 [Dioscorea sansibarensis]